MSPAGTSDGVVDPKFKVKGTANLRIVDASIFVSIIPLERARWLELTTIKLIFSHELLQVCSSTVHSFELS